MAIGGWGRAFRSTRDLLLAGVIVGTLFEVMFVDVLVNPLGVDPTELIVLMVFTQLCTLK